MKAFIRNLLPSLLLCSFLIFSLTGFSQSKKPVKKSRPFQVTVVGEMGQKLAAGYLYQLNEKSIILVESDEKKMVDQRVTEVPVTSIETLKFRRKGQVLRGFIIGVLGSIAASFIVQAASENDDEAGWAILGVLAVGWIPTTILSTFRAHHKIGRMPFVYRKKKKELEMYILPALP
ncbi:MAG: hypothetical protein AAFR61_06285 [Bacteroidota bacterium]